jgi:hypothetical protein
MRLTIKTSLIVAIAALTSTFITDFAQAQVRDAASKVRGGYELNGFGRRSNRSYSYAPRTRSVAPAIVTEQAVTTTTPTDAATANAGTTTKKPEAAKKPQVAKKPEAAKKPQTAKKPAAKKPAPTTTEGGVAAAPRRSYRSYSYEGNSGSMSGTYSGGYRNSGRRIGRERFSFDAGRKVRGMGE